MRKFIKLFAILRDYKQQIELVGKSRLASKLNELAN